MPEIDKAKIAASQNQTETANCEQNQSHSAVP
jgi:hypothetical protein